MPAPPAPRLELIHVTPVKLITNSLLSIAIAIEVAIANSLLSPLTVAENKILYDK